MTNTTWPDAFLSPFAGDEAVARALAEELGRAGDGTSVAAGASGVFGRAVVGAREAGVISGLPLVEAAFRKLDPEVKLTAHACDGDAVAAGTALVAVEGKARGLLGAERTALNFLGHLSGIATATPAFVRLLAGTRARVCCARKTTPGRPALQEYAVP